MLTPIVLTWEYPPRVVGDLSHYVENLAERFNGLRFPLRVVTCNDSGFKYEKPGEYLEIYRASNPVKTHVSVLTWCLSFNSEIERVVADLVYDRVNERHVLDVQDWHFVPAGACLRRALGLPFVFTLHSLEQQRSPGSTFALNSCISGLERMGLLESDLVVVKTEAMRRLVVDNDVPESKVVVVPPGEADWVERLMKCYEAANASGGESY